jgi:predicted Ser/Thr protein kinase
MIALDNLYLELVNKPALRNGVSAYRGSHGDCFVKLCRRRERRFLLRNEARFAERFRNYDFCPTLIGFRDFDDASLLVYRRVTGVSLMNVLFVTRRMISLVSDALDRINDTLARERICQLDPSPNNIIINPRSGHVWYIDYELCAPFGTEAEITDFFALDTTEEKQVLSQAFRTAACQYKPASMAEYGDAFNRFMNGKMLGDLQRRQHLAGISDLIAYKLRRFWQRANR